MFNKLKKFLTTALVSVTMLTSAFSLISNNNYNTNNVVDATVSTFPLKFYFAVDKEFISGVSNPYLQFVWKDSNGTYTSHMTEVSGKTYNSNKIYVMDDSLGHYQTNVWNLYVDIFDGGVNGSWKTKCILWWASQSNDNAINTFNNKLVVVNNSKTWMNLGNGYQDSWEEVFGCSIINYTDDSQSNSYDIYYYNGNKNDNTYIYCWDSHGDNGAFGTTKMSSNIVGYDGIIPVYKYSYKRISPYENVIFSWGDGNSNKTADLDISNGKMYDPITNSWMSLPSTVKSAKSYTVYYTKLDTMWPVVRCHIWNKGTNTRLNPSTTYPGEKMSSTGRTYNNTSNVYSYTYSSSVRYSNCLFDYAQYEGDSNHFKTSDLTMIDSVTNSILYDQSNDCWIKDPFYTYYKVNDNDPVLISAAKSTRIQKNLKAGDKIYFYAGYSFTNCDFYQPKTTSTYYANGALESSNNATVVKYDGMYYFDFSFVDATKTGVAISCDAASYTDGIVAHRLIIDSNVKVAYKIRIAPTHKFKLEIYTDSSYADIKCSYVGSNTVNSGAVPVDEEVILNEVYSPQYYSEYIYAKCILLYENEAEVYSSKETYCINDYLTSMAEKNPTNKMYENMKTYGDIAANASYVDTTGLSDAISGANSKRVYRFTTDTKTPKAISDLRITLGSAVNLSFKFNLSVYSALSNCSLYLKDGDTISLLGDKGEYSIPLFYSQFSATKQLFIGSSADISSATSVLNINGYQFIYSALQSNQTTAHEKAVYIALYNFISTIGTN